MGGGKMAFAEIKREKESGINSVDGNRAKKG